MSYLVIWTARAAVDLQTHYLFLAEKDPEAGLRAVEAIDASTTILEQFPNAGRPAEDLEPEHRELLVPFGAAGYILLYQVEEKSVYILAVRHQLGPVNTILEPSQLTQKRRRQET